MDGNAKEPPPDTDLRGHARSGGGVDFDALVSKTPQTTDIPVYADLATALAAAPVNGTLPFRIRLDPGAWRERVTVDRPNVHLIGMGMDRSRLVFCRHAGLAGPDGAPIGTFETATLKVVAPGFRAEALTISNDYAYVDDLPDRNGDKKVGHHGAQAVALAIEGDADRTVLERVRLESHQDTLYVAAGRALFRHCRIEGNVDFIFGPGRACFDRSIILSRQRPGRDVAGFIAAPNTDIHQEHGLVFSQCRLERAPGVADKSVALGRPWRRTTQFADGFYGSPDHVGACAYLKCWMDAHIVSEGWHPMSYNKKGGGQAVLEPEDARFYEFASTGPGAGQPSARRRTLSEDEADAYSIENVLEGWAG